MIQISFTDAPDIVTTITIDDVEYKLRVMYNQSHKFWTFHVWDYNDNPILTSIRVVPNFPLLFNKHCFDVPKGEFMVISDLEELDRDSFRDGKATLVYLTREEWNAV